VVWSFTVQPAHCNGNRTLHGGCIATLFDYCTTMPVMLVSSVADGFWSRMGVTRTLNMTYLRPIPVGTEIRIVCEVLAVGKRLGAIRGEMRRASDDALLVTCEHGRVNTDPPPKKGNKL
ncbi:HotDog domain-containing protein, partial [Bombardia bombarda]